MLSDRFDNHVFALTDKGVSAMVDNKTTVGDSVRSVLAVIDGVCPVAQYRPFLQALEPLHDKFQLLIERGYIEMVGTVANSAISEFKNSTLERGVPAARAKRIDSEARVNEFLPTGFNDLKSVPNSEIENL